MFESADERDARRELAGILIASIVESGSPRRPANSSSVVGAHRAFPRRRQIDLLRMTPTLVPMLCSPDAALLPSPSPDVPLVVHLANVHANVFVMHCLGELDDLPVVCPAAQPYAQRFAVSLDLESA